LSAAWWDRKHSRDNGNPNRVSQDPDIALYTISFLEVDAATARGARRALTRHQGRTFFPLLTLETLNPPALSFRHLHPPGTPPGLWTGLSLITTRFAAYLLPLFLLLGPGMAFAFLGVQMAVFGVYLGASFAPNHKGMPIIAKDAKLDFFTKQVRTSRNVSGGWWATWLMGGLNYQVEHHLFPNMPRLHLARAREIVMEQCDTLGVPYTETTLWRSYGIVIAYLKRVGLAARDPFDCPMVGSYRKV